MAARVDRLAGAIPQPAHAALLLLVALGCALLVWRLRAWLWGQLWRWQGDRIAAVIPDRAWVWVRRWQWPQLAWRAGLTRPQGTGAGAAIEYLGGRWRPIPNGFVVVGRLLDGQTPIDYSRASEPLAESWQVARVAVDSPARGWVRITALWFDPLAVPFRAPLPNPRPDLRALVLGRREDGFSWTERLIGRHVLVAGATGAGKGSVQWSVIRALGPLLRWGVAEVWTADPKRIEFASGRRLFARYAAEPAEIVELVEQAAQLVADRARRLAGYARTHTPRRGDPFVLLNIDELAFLTAYLSDRKLKERFAAALATVLTQGRALGVAVLAAAQDPRKETVPLRQLFTTRIALRLDEPSQVDLVLGDGAADRGAAAHLIPRDEARGAGIAYVLTDGDPTPRRVRAGYVSDRDIAWTVATFTP
ncbi:FtsK/SpoIIIE domain-containing protein [Cryptosporangium sp. NPDC051539]|uniref:FtsK/SpoIIIE domain-containing protein n=1 Tax=Cryptosporangium sp. NPDC051539 TaxID=3363962 RepID=UPI0037979B81